MPVNALSRYLAAKHNEYAMDVSWKHYVADSLRNSIAVQVSEPEKVFKEIPRYYDITNTRERKQAHKQEKPDMTVNSFIAHVKSRIEKD